MSNTFERRYTITSGMHDECGNITVYSILELFQDIAKEHANLLLCGESFCDEQSVAWIIVKTYLELLEYKSKISEAIVVTKVHVLNKFEALREYYLKDLDGNVLAYGKSIWVLLNLFTKKFYPINDIHKGISQDNEFPKIPRVKSCINDEFECISYRVVRSDIDTNHHMNNTLYVRLAVDTFNLLSKQIKSILISYQNEIKINDIMCLYKQIKENTLSLSGKSKDKIIFSCEIKLNGDTQYAN